MDILNTAYCRLCAKLKSSDRISNFQTDISVWNEIIAKLTQINIHIDVKQDNLPKTVCMLCFRALNAAFEFAKSVENAQKILPMLKADKRKKYVVFLKNEEKNQINNVQNFCKTYGSEHEYCDNENSNVANNHIKIEVNTNNNENLLTKYVMSAESTKLSCDNTKKNWQDYNWTCSYCDILFLTINDLQKHSLEIHSKCNGYKCTECGIRRRDLNKFIQHICTHNKHLKLSCYKCFVTYAINSKFEKHTHTSTEYVCNGCNTCFSSLENLETHKKKYYTYLRTKRPQTNGQFGLCKICNKTYKCLSMHMSIHRERTRNYTCEKCGKSYLTRENLKQHYITHSTDKPYECKICKESFKTIPYLRSHVIVHNNVKPFSCDKCGKRYSRLKTLNGHKKTHTDTCYECNICNKRYKLKKQLTFHIKLHKGIMPYSCDTCQWKFTNYSNYFKHMKRKHDIDIRKKKLPSTLVHLTDASILKWKEELAHTKPWQRRRQLQHHSQCLSEEAKGIIAEHNYHSIPT